jgi:hypothetical protein
MNSSLPVLILTILFWCAASSLMMFALTSRLNSRQVFRVLRSIILELARSFTRDDSIVHLEASVTGSIYISYICLWRDVL